ncbi:MAG: glycoside hydrolase family 172 protein [Candidatus Bathyarchaeia archaeon]
MKVEWVGSSLRDLPRLRDCKRRRISSWDRTGGNADYIVVPEGATAILANIRGAGCITHIWLTIACDTKWYLRKMLIRMFWDGERDPSVEVPIGDFFGIGHGITKNFVSLPLTMSPQHGRGFNCYFPMPFSDGARVEVVNECECGVRRFYYYIDYEQHDKLEDGLGRFHAIWNRENPCEGISDVGLTNEEYQFGGTNLTGEGNYVILEAAGKGHYVGCSLNIHNLRQTDKRNWYGEGDDMIFIDGDELPTINGTGTEDYFNMAWCPAQEYCSPYHGLPLPGGSNWSGKITLYRFHIEDPVYFERSIRVTIEHGHANRRSDDYSSTAYWYQTEPHKKFHPMLPVDERLPRE